MATNTDTHVCVSTRMDNAFLDILGDTSNSSLTPSFLNTPFVSIPVHC